MYPEKKGGSHKMARPQQNWGLLTLLLMRSGEFHNECIKQISCQFDQKFIFYYRNCLTSQRPGNPANSVQHEENLMLSQKSNFKFNRFYVNPISPCGLSANFRKLLHEILDESDVLLLCAIKVNDVWSFAIMR